MNYAYYVFGELTFPSGKIKGWRVARVDPAGLEWDEDDGIYNGRCGTTTVPALVESGRAFSGASQGYFFAIDIRKDRAAFRGWLSKDDLEWARQMVTAARLAAPFGAEGELVFLMSTGDAVSRLQVETGEVTWEESGRAEASVFMKRPEVDEIAARLEGRPKPGPGQAERESRAAARELGLSDVSEMAFGLPDDARERRALGKAPSPEHAAVERRALARIEAFPPAALLEASRRLDEGVEVYRKEVKGGGEPLLAREAFHDGAELLGALKEAAEKGSHPVHGKSLQGLALTLLGALDPDASDPLALELFASTTAPPQLRAAAARALGYSARDEAFDALFGALTAKPAPPEVVREAVVEALGRSRHPAAGEKVLSALRERLGKATPRGRHDVAAIAPLLEILGGLAYAPALEALLALWKKGSPELRRAAGWALLGFSAPEALEPLAAKWTSRDDEMEELGVKAVFRLGPGRAYDTFAPLFEKDFARNHNAHHQVLTVLAELADDAEAPPTGRTHGALRKDPRWLDICVRLLQSEDMQDVALRALSLSGSSAAAAAITQRLDDLDLDEAGEALLRLGDVSVAPALRAKAAGKRKSQAAKILRVVERLEQRPT